MAAYASLISLMHIIEQIEHYPLPPISLDNQQIESLTKNVAFMQEYLEHYSSQFGYNDEADALEMRIADAAHAAEDVIELHIVDQILQDQAKETSSEFKTGLKDAIEGLDLIKKEVMEMKDKLGARSEMQPTSSSSSSSSGSSRLVTVGLDDALYDMLDKLTGGQPSRQFIPIVGMGGIGKTTLARKVFENQLIAHHFDILVWITISQEYSIRTLLELACVETMRADRESLNEMSEDKLGEKLYKSLIGERYLITLDDVWDIEVCESLKIFFPNNRNGSRVMITTRLSNLALHLSYNSYSFEVKFLDDDASWNLLCKNVFGKEICPLELVDIGKRIAKNCSGLPLSIVVIGGLLAKSERTREYWEHILNNLISIVTLEENECCLKILHTSYRQLPVHLKPCFLYMGTFPEDDKVHVSKLIKLLVGEGFLKPIRGRSYEEVAGDYVQELIDRNLILVDSYCFGGKVKVCKLHDLVRVLCLKEAERQRFFCFLTEKSSCLGIPQERKEFERPITVCQKLKSKEGCSPDHVFEALGSARFARSWIWEFQEPFPSLGTLRLLRVCSIFHEEFPKASFDQLVNLRCLFLDVMFPQRIPSTSLLLWNLEILVVEVSRMILIPSEIWEMPLIRHVVFNKAQLADPPIGDDNVLPLERLQTLVEIHSFKCSKEVVKRIPNIKKLKIYYEEFTEGPRNCIKNLGLLHKLESLGIVIDPFPDVEKTQRHLVQNLTFPHSLKKLTISHTRLKWEDLTSKIGSLPFLEALKLKWQSFIGPKWETVEGKFCSLRFLLVEFCDLEEWIIDNSTHFPLLKRVVLRELPLLEEIDSNMGDIATLEAIELEYCAVSAVFSAKSLLEEQEELGNESLRVRVLLLRMNKELLSLANHNFQVKTDMIDK